MSNVSGVIKSIQDIMRKDVGVDGDAQRISQLVWMFFLKILDDREEELELVDNEFVSPIPEHLRWRSWAADREGITGDALLDFVNLQLFPKLKGDLPAIGEVGKRAKIVRDVFEDTYNYMKSGTLMRQVINKINEIDFNNTDDRHTFGAIYEQILRDLQSAGNAGEFYTPRAVTKFIIDRLSPRLDEVVLDPACGTGGFLACAIDHKRKAVRTNEDEELLQRTIRGVEKKALPHMLCVTNMILHGIDTPSGILHGNTLERAYRDYGERDRVPVIATNPPFGGMEQDGIERNFPAHLRTRETADLFMALIIKLLRSGGRAAVVLPDGFLFGEGVKTTLKRQLIEECNLHTIVRLPSGVFSPYTGIKTNILFFTKGTPTSSIWYYEHPYPLGVKTYNKSRPMQFVEFEEAIDWWGEEADGFRTRRQTNNAWRVSATEIAERGYNLDLKNPHRPTKTNHDPNILLRRYADEETKLRYVQKQLQDLLNTVVRKSGLGEDAGALINGNLDVWTTAVEYKATAGRGSSARPALYGIERLKTLILELAVRGKLEPQDPRDEPASTLIQAVRKQKRVLDERGDRGRVRKAGLPTGEPPFEIPDSWQWVQISEIGHDWGQEEPQEEFTYIDVGSIDQTRGVITEPSVVAAKDAPSRARKIVRPGTVLYSTVRPYLLNIAVVGKTFDPPPIASTAFAVIHPYDGIEAAFIYRFLRSPPFVRYVESCQTGIAYPAINDKQFFSAWFPLPPTQEQRRIVEKVDQLMLVSESLGTSIEQMGEVQCALADVVVERAFT